MHSVSLFSREVAFLHLFLSLFFLVEHLCQNEDICAGLWELYEFVTGLVAADENADSVADMYVYTHMCVCAVWVYVCASSRGGKNTSATTVVCFYAGRPVQTPANISEHHERTESRSL